MVVCECPHRSDARRLRICSTSSGADATAAPPVLWATGEVALPPPAADGGGKGAAGFLGWLASAADMAGGPCTPPEASYRRWCAVRLRVGLCTARGRLLVFGATPGGGRQHAASRWGRPAGGGPGGRGRGWLGLPGPAGSVSLTHSACAAVTHSELKDESQLQVSVRGSAENGRTECLIDQ
jgi:hypothetical protein